MKEIEVTNEIKSEPFLLKDVQRMTQLLEEEIGPSASRVKAEWRLQHSPLGPKLELTISDESDHSSLVLSSSSLASMSVDELRILLIRLWGDVLQERSHRLIEKLMSELYSLETA